MSKCLESLADRLISLGPLLRILECPVCLEVVKSPFMQCQRGHLVCSGCMKALPNCPSCEADFSFEDPVCLKALIESLPRPCGYAGCKDMIEPNSNHQLYCGFRLVACRKCLNDTPVYQVKEHFEDNQHDGLYTSKSMEINLLDIAEDSSYTSLICLEDQIFWLVLETSNELLEIKWMVDFNGNPKKEYFITLKFEKDIIGSRVTLKATDLSRVSKEEEICSTNVCLSSVKHCIDDENNLTVEYNVFSKPKLA